MIRVGVAVLAALTLLGCASQPGTLAQAHAAAAKVAYDDCLDYRLRACPNTVWPDRYDFCRDVRRQMLQHGVSMSYGNRCDAS